MAFEPGSMSTDQNPYQAPSAGLDPPDPQPLATGDPYEPRGIGGWLVLPLLSICGSIVNLIRGLPATISPLVEAEIWNHRDDQPLLIPWAIFDVAETLAMLGFTVVLLWLFLKRSRRVPKLMIAWLVATVLFIVVDHLEASLSQAPWRGAESVLTAAVLGFLSRGLWVAYFLKSVRVKNTFVR
jgi:hypothetical protein